MSNKTRTVQLTKRYESALVFAHQLHQQQIRTITGVPYISHLLSVSALVLEDGGDEDQAIAALLHDAIEDQGGQATANLIRQKFGTRVAEIVSGCTEVKSIPSWRERKEKYLDNFRNAPPSVRRVILADKLHNARCNLWEYYHYGSPIWSVFTEGKQGLLWFYQSIITIASETPESHLLLEEFKRVVQQIEQLR